MPTRPPTLTSDQEDIARSPLDARLFLEGPAGAGKTTTAAARLRHLLESDTPGEQVLVLTPQRTLAGPYRDLIADPRLAHGGLPAVTTLGGLARRTTELFWPLAAETAGFARPDLPPTFLNIETAQYHMARVAGPLLEQGFFEGATIDRNRLFAQILDNLNKAAFVRFPHDEIGRRLQAAWVDQSHQRRLYQDAQTCATMFRRHCLENNLLDFSLTLEVFLEHLWVQESARSYLTGTWRHLVVDNLEEDTPAAHDLLLDWLAECDSAFLVFDWEAGFRRFLGADPISAYRLKDACDELAELHGSHVTSPEIDALQAGIALHLNRPAEHVPLVPAGVLQFEFHRFYPQMLDWVAATIESLVFEHGLPPREIVVLAPYLSDALRFSLMNRLQAAGVPVQSHRPSRALVEEPAARSLLTLAAIAHPDWGLVPPVFDVAYALRQSIDGLDAVRAHLLAEILYRTPQARPTLHPFDEIKADVQERITYVIGGRYDALRLWLENQARKPAAGLDLFLGRLFGEVLSQPGYHFHRDLDAGKAAANLIDSARQFRHMVGPQLAAEGLDPGKAFLESVRNGVLASQHLRSWELQDENAVLVAPAYTFLMADRPVDFQFWLNVSSSGWFERLYQPLTHPHVLSRNWRPEQPWTDLQEVETNRDTMFRLLTGLLRRCRRGVFLGISELDEHGFEQKGQLLKTVQKILRGVET